MQEAVFDRCPARRLTGQNERRESPSSASLLTHMNERKCGTGAIIDDDRIRN